MHEKNQSDVQQLVFTLTDNRIIQMHSTLVLEKILYRLVKASRLTQVKVEEVKVPETFTISSSYG
jgi:hypothetical protein